MGSIGIVTDSTSDLSAEELVRLDVTMVPLKVLFGDRTYLDWVELPPAEFYPMLANAEILPKTSQPSPAEFLATYRELAERGCTEIVSVHLTSALSGTVASALMAAEESPIPVHVVDTKKVSHSLSLVVRAAVEARDSGADAEGIVARAQSVSQEMRFLFVLETLEYLVKGGRAGKAQGLAASLLGIKPILTVNADGIVEPYKKVKGRKRALQLIAAEVARDAAANGRMRLTVLHACLDDEGAELLREIEATGADIELMPNGLIGAVIGTYVGQGAIGCAYYPVE
ncbi:MAG: DegV family protein [Coriobacteriia bacterium]|nr:DegV family protein [Coriobacteriia bacterium]